ncbi:MAG TPA: M28 family peptidase [Planctomycetota bacterium]|nr:M28 family peptidase [Planctomycetota bacterium]
MHRASTPLVLAALLLAGCFSPPSAVPAERYRADAAWLAEPPSAVPAERYRADVAWLADDARAGRDTGSPGLEQAAAWVAEQFEEAGLQPLGDDGGWLERFTVRGQRRLAAGGNVLVVGGTALELGKEWRPLRTALSADVHAPLVFAGYGISDPEGGRDDYAGLEVKDKVVAVLRKGPHSDDKGTRYAAQDADGKDNPGQEHISFAGKVNAAYRHGAAALLVINDPAHFAPGSPEDAPQPFTSLGPGGEGGRIGASLPAASLTAEAGGRLGLDLAGLQAALDRGERPTAGLLEGVAGELGVRAERPQIATANVLGYLPGADPAVAGEYVLIGAHMDHLGLGSADSSRGGPAAMGQIHNGADDNASGTAGLVEVARLLGARRGELRRGVVFAAWSGEELGLLGSRHYAEEPALPLGDLVAVVNRDMIGRSKDGYVAVEGVGTSPGFKELVTSAHDGLGGDGLDLHLAERPSDNSDQASFYDKSIPVLAFFTGLHDDYHMPSDDADKINAQAGAAIATLAGEVVRRLSEADDRPSFTRPGAPAAQVAAAGDPHAQSAGGPDASAPVPYRVVFGTSPDMSYQQDDGVRIASVRSGTPAEACGLLAGDLIVALDDKPVRTLEDYSTLLFSHKPGDSITVGVRRGTEALTLTAVLAGHSGPN